MPDNQEERPSDAADPAGDGGDTAPRKAAGLSDKTAAWLGVLRRSRIYLIIGLIAVLAAVIVATYPYWQGGARDALARFGIDFAVPQPDDEAAGTGDAPQPAVVATAGSPAPERQDPATTAAGATPKPATPPDSPAPSDNRVAALEEQLGRLAARVNDIEAANEARPPAASEEAVAGLAEDLRGLDVRIAAIENRPAAPAGRLPGTPDLSALLATTIGLAERIAALEALERVDPAAIASIGDEVTALTPRLAELDSRLSALTESVESHPGRDRAALVLLAVSQLAVATAGSEPFRAQFDALRGIVPDEPAWSEPMQQLSQHADTGAPGLSLLRNSFENAVAAAVQSRSEDGAENQFDKTLARVTSLFTIRKIDDPGSGTVDGALAAADIALAAGDLQAVIAALDALDGPPANAVDPWLSDIRARLAVNTALTALHALAIAALAAAG